MPSSTAASGTRTTGSLRHFLHVSRVQREIADEQEYDQPVNRRRQYTPPTPIIARDREPRRR
jgi:hypothetical protein